MSLLDRIAAWCVPDRIAPSLEDEFALLLESIRLDAQGLIDRNDAMMAAVDKTLTDVGRRILYSADDAPFAVEQWKAWVGEAGGPHPPVWH